MKFTKPGSVVAILIALTITACGTVPLPSNVSVIEGGSASGPYVDKVNFSYPSPTAAKFSKLKQCIAENVSNEGTTLTDSSRSFVGAYSGHYYQNGTTQTTAGGNVFKFVDEDSATLVANGATIAQSNALLTQQAIKFELKAGVSDKNVTLVFFNITHAQKDTGFAQNTGFNPVGTWNGAGTMNAYSALEIMANKIKSCLD